MIIKMRMWNIESNKMCNQHLLGEHLELHMFVGTIKKGISIKGYIKNGLVEVNRIRERHTELAFEMMLRGMNHNSDLPFFKITNEGSVDTEENIKELALRCSDCRGRIENGKH